MSALSHTAPAAVLPILAPDAGGEQRAGEGVELMRAHAPAEIDAVDDVAPLVGAAHLQIAAVAARQLHEVVGLQDHVVELDERQLLLALEPQLHRVHGQHAVDREVPADVAQQVDVVELRQPLGVVDHDGVALGREPKRRNLANVPLDRLACWLRSAR